MIEHKRLIDYLPPFLAEYREYKRIMNVIWYEISEKNGSILKRADRLLMNTFVDETDLEGVKRWEKLLNIIPDAEMTLEDRRESVKVKLAGRRPFTKRKLEEILNQIAGAGEYTAVMTDTFQLTVKLAITSKYKRGAVSDLIRQIAPANIELIVDLLYHQHEEFEDYTHGDLSVYTHHDLREEVISNE